MKVYDLRCEHDHLFEGWFSAEDDFIAQSTHKLLACPICHSTSIIKMLSAPRLNLSAAQSPPALPTQNSPEEHSDSMQQQAEWLAQTRSLLNNTEDVGTRFAEEARRIHYQETPERGIRGVATSDERAALADEGIHVLPLHLPQALKQTLQ